MPQAYQPDPQGAKPKLTDPSWPEVCRRVSDRRASLAATLAGSFVHHDDGWELLISVPHFGSFQKSQLTKPSNKALIEAEASAVYGPRGVRFVPAVPVAEPTQQPPSSALAQTMDFCLKGDPLILLSFLFALQVEIVLSSLSGESERTDFLLAAYQGTKKLQAAKVEP